MKRFASLMVLLAAPAMAQNTTLDIQTASPVAVLCTSGAQQDFTGVAAGTVVSSHPNTLNIRAGLDQGTYLSATTIAYPTQGFQESIGMNFFQRAYARGATSDVAGTSASASANGATHGMQTMRLSFGNAPGRVGRLVFNFRANPGTTGTVLGSIDVGANGTIDFQTTQGATHEVPWTMGASGTVDVLVGSECRVSGSGNPSDFQSCWTEIWVGFRPDITAQCTFTNYGSGCNGVQAVGSEFVGSGQRVVTFLVTGAYPGAPVLAVVGTNQLNIPLPASCSLLSTIESVLVIHADTAGVATQTWAFPATETGTSFHQFLPIRANAGGAVELSASNGIRLECRR